MDVVGAGLRFYKNIWFTQVTTGWLNQDYDGWTGKLNRGKQTAERV